MAYGIVEYDNHGLPKCELCNKYFHRVLSHVRQKHFMNEREYKIMFGFDVKKGITSQQSKQKSKEAVLKNFDKCITDNLIVKGKISRYKKGDKGRTKEFLSQQTKLRLSNLAKTNLSKEQRQILCRKLGLSGIGNKKRWNKFWRCEIVTINI